jgi:molybdopterin synthase sulfur carrier subunit
MPNAIVELPSLLAHLNDGNTDIPVSGDSIAEALASLLQRCPGVGVHLFDETGHLREHVLCFHNERNTRWLESLDVAIEEGDRLRIYQAVSGG